MNLKKIEEIAQNTMLNNQKAQPLRDAGYIYHHGKRVAELSQWLCGKVGSKGVNKSTLTVAALFHDVAKGKAHHALAGSKIIADILGENVSTTQAKEIERLIREHNLREAPNKCNKDSKILQDADILDHLGCQGGWLSTCITIKSGKSQEDMLRYVNGPEEKAYLKERFQQLNYAAAKAEFKRRIRLQRYFFKRLKEEMFLKP